MKTNSNTIFTPPFANEEKLLSILILNITL